MKSIKLEELPHKIPKDLIEAIKLDPSTLTKWESLTPLSQNEFICWVGSAKQIDTRKNRIKRVCRELNEGKRRPCCWYGCIHRKDKKLNPSQRWLQKTKKI